MITIFTIPRPFTGEFDHIQRNALRSWLQLSSTPEVMLFGEEEGVTDVCAELGLSWYPVDRNEHDTPLVNDALNKARWYARYDILCMANADNIYLGNFTRAVQCCAESFDQFLMIGQRWNLQVDELIDFDPGREWESELFLRLLTEGKLHHRSAIDYLVFRDGDWLEDLPSFAVGRSAYDNDIVARTREACVPIVDATGAVTVVHQNHGHVNSRHTNEARLNRQLHKEGRVGRGGVGQAGWIMLWSGEICRKKRKRKNENEGDT